MSAERVAQYLVDTTIAGARLSQLFGECAMRVAGLFAGVGGMEHGLAAAGHEAVLLCEIAEPARASLAAQFANVAMHGDVTTLAQLPERIDLVCAGFPCQDLSQAGLTRGLSGSRSSLVSHVFRLIDGHPVSTVVLENVSFMLQLGKGQAMRALTQAFEERGFRWAYRVVNSLGFLPQRRERVFIVASRGEIEPSDVLFVDNAHPSSVETTLDTHAHGFYWTEGVRGLGWAPDAVPTLKGGSTIGIPSPPAVLLPDGRLIKPDIRDAERLQGFPVDWTAAAAAGHGKGARWSLVGNAVTVPVAAWLGRRLAQPGRFMPHIPPVAPKGAGWPRAARGANGRVEAIDVGPFPVWTQRPSLHSFLCFDGEPLSARATRGFLRRTDTSTLRFQTGFRERVRQHLTRVEQLALAAE